jgi:hypothetical protein
MLSLELLKFQPLDVINIILTRCHGQPIELLSFPAELPKYIGASSGPTPWEHSGPVWDASQISLGCYSVRPVWDASQISFTRRSARIRRTFAREGPIRASTYMFVLESIGHLECLQIPSRHSKDSRLALQELGFGKDKSKGKKIKDCIFDQLDTLNRPWPFIFIYL